MYHEDSAAALRRLVAIANATGFLDRDLVQTARETARERGGLRPFGMEGVGEEREPRTEVGHVPRGSE